MNIQYMKIKIIFGGPGQSYDESMGITEQNTDTLFTRFSHMGHNEDNLHNVHFDWGPSIVGRLGPSCFPAILSPISIYMLHMETFQ